MLYPDALHVHKKAGYMLYPDLVTRCRAPDSCGSQDGKTADQKRSPEYTCIVHAFQEFFCSASIYDVRLLSAEMRLIIESERSGNPASTLGFERFLLQSTRCHILHFRIQAFRRAAV